MNNIVQILPEKIINRIAAGEVVDRPASVVKELVENSIDAGADNIIISIKNSGKDLIQVIDNGSGMTEGDSITAFERHATSKIINLDDLDEINTLGFRGEALASIAAVSRVELKTRKPEAHIGTMIKIAGGKIEDKTPVNMNHGTQISIKNLFYNTPARRSFLKTPATENSHITRMVKRFLLAKPQIQFKFYNDDKVIYDRHGESLESRVGAILGEATKNNFIEIDHQMGEIVLYGFVGKPESSTRDRQQQFLFLNGRSVHSKNINFSVYKSFGEMIPENTFPPFVLYLKIDPKLIDVNVHPTKSEVRFANERVILNFFQQSIRQAFEKNKIFPEFMSDSDENTDQKKSLSNDFSNFDSSLEKGRVKQRKDITDYIDSIRNRKDVNHDQFTLSYSESKFQNVNGIIASSKEKSEKLISEESTRPIWQLLKSYVQTEISSGIILIDQYRAHYRVLYEKIIRNVHKSEFWGSQQLLFPQNFELSLEDYIIFQEIAPYLEKIGFVILPYSGHTVCIEAIPSEVRNGSESGIIFEILTAYKHEIANHVEIFERFARAFSQKNAIKKGETLKYGEMAALIDHLFACEQPYYTPDGKPIIVTMSANEIENKFTKRQ